MAPSAQDQLLGAGDGVATVFALRKAYASGPARYWRPVAKPVAGTVLVAVGGVELRAGVGYEVDGATGLVSLAAPPPVGAEVTAGFEFDVPVCFDTDRIAVSVASFQAGDLPQVPVIEVRT